MFTGTNVKKFLFHSLNFKLILYLAFITFPLTTASPTFNL